MKRFVWIYFLLVMACLGLGAGKIDIFTGQWRESDSGSGSPSGGAQSAALAIYAYTQDVTVNPALNGSIITNHSATSDIEATLPACSSLSAPLAVGFANKVGTVSNATGGTITTDGNYKIHTFTSSGTFEVLSGTMDVEILVVAGGGGGASKVDNNGQNGQGGGGAGGLIYQTAVSTANGSHSIVIGSGGISNANGENSTALSLTAIGGGCGGKNTTGGSGGSGGGGGAGSSSGGTATSLQGYNGGTGVGSEGAGGGGSGGVGGNGSDGAGGAGGIGTELSITGTAVYYAGGGGGGCYIGGAKGLGGTGGGGNAGEPGASGVNATGYGSGGGSAGGGNGVGLIGGTGSNGIVVIKYLSSGASSAITITPNSADQIPGTASAGSSLKSSAKDDFLELILDPGTGIIRKSAVPIANWIDQMNGGN